jgi:hypothetical protein
MIKQVVSAVVATLVWSSPASAQGLHVYGPGGPEPAIRRVLRPFWGWPALGSQKYQRLNFIWPARVPNCRRGAVAPIKPDWLMV